MAILSFKGKSFVQNYHLAVKYHELIPKKTKSLTDKVSLKDNLIIHGDNLKALKALLPTYARKVKCIYIDPPYNTGNEDWVYNDNVNSPMMQEWLGKVVDKDDLTRSDKWLCMMMPRLKLLRELLSNDGLIFISIDDNEQANLKLLCDEVFNEANFISKITVQSNPRGSQASKFLAEVHEYIIIYAKSKDLLKIKGLGKTEESISEYVYTNEKGSKYRLLGLRQRGGAWKREQRPHMFFPLYVNPKNNTVSADRTDEYCIEALPKRPTGEEGRWTWSLEKVKANINALVGKKVTRRGLENFYDIFRKDFLYDEEGKQSTTKPKTIWIEKQLNYQNGRNEIKEIFGGDIFDYPKPSFLVKKAIEIIADSDSLILDSFAGSGTTGHAVLDLNQEDGGTRRFILVECLDYADNITAERIRRIVKGVPSARDEKLQKGLGSSFSFFELGEPIEMESILEGSRLPTYLDLARYVFYTATGEEFLPEQVNEDSHFIGESKEYEVYLFYKPDLTYLKSTALTLDIAKTLGEYTGKKKLVFAPTKYLDLNDSELLAKHGLKGIEYCQLPFEIYKLRE